MSNIIKVKSGTSVPAQGVLAANELGVARLQSGAHLFVGNEDGTASQLTPMEIAEIPVVSSLSAQDWIIIGVGADCKKMLVSDFLAALSSLQ